MTALLLIGGVLLAGLIIQRAGAEPSKQDLFGGQEPGTLPAGKPNPQAQAPLSEGEQAMEHQLRRVPDDPGGLLRQRFMLQHLRRQGQLP